MSLSADAVLRDSLKRVTHVYIESLARSYRKFQRDAASIEEYSEFLFAYVEIITREFGDICHEAKTGINSYLYLYNIHAKESADEFKIVYYLGMTIYKHLQRNGAAVTAQVHLFAMIGLLDDKLKSLGIHKPQLVRALTTLVRNGRFESELGATGCYLIYKCVSTVDREGPAPSAT